MTKAWQEDDEELNQASQNMETSWSLVHNEDITLRIWHESKCDILISSVKISTAINQKG